jgi:large subunit ribosomal protein L7/L12
MAIESREEVVEWIKALTVLELSELVGELEEALGVSAAAPAAAMAAGPGAAAEVAAEQTEFTVELIDFGDKKIQVIKAVRGIVDGLGLKEAKAFVEDLPKAVKEGISKDEANEIKATLEGAGASCTIK